MHPNAIDLEAFACGEPSDAVSEHVKECAACRVYVDRAGVIAKEPPRVLVRPRAPKSSPARVVSIVAPFAVAAAALLWIGRTRAPVVAAPVEQPVAIATTAAPEPDTTFKGGMQLAVIRERDGVQQRFTGTVRVRPGDRLRIEVAIDRSRTILGGVIADDGSYLELMPDGVRNAGTHFSEKSTRIDAHPERGTIVVGTAEDVARARQTKNVEGLATIRVEEESP